MTLGKNQSSAQKYHSKSSISTLFTHIKLQAYHDLPIYDDHFKSFKITSQETYSFIDLKAFSAPRKINVGRPSYILLGHLDKQRSYQTEHNTSFINHPNIPLTGNLQVHKG